MRYAAIARLRGGVTLEQARADLGAVAAALAEEHPEPNADMGAIVTPLNDELVGDVRPALLLLLGAVGFVLLLACANVAHLFLARVPGRCSRACSSPSARATRGSSRAWRS